MSGYWLTFILLSAIVIGVAVLASRWRLRASGWGLLQDRYPGVCDEGESNEGKATLTLWRGHGTRVRWVMDVEHLHLEPIEAAQKSFRVAGHLEYFHRPVSIAWRALEEPAFLDSPDEIAFVLPEGRILLKDRILRLRLEDRFDAAGMDRKLEEA